MTDSTTSFLSTAVLEAIADPLLVLDGPVVRFANAPARAMLGDMVVNEDIRLILRHPDATALIASGSDGAVEFSGIGSKDQRFELRIARASDSVRVVQLFDRSARHLAERMRTDFVANVSHELRTPLATIRGFIETLSDEEAGSEPALRQRFLGIMKREALRMGRLIEELISLSRIEADRYVLPDSVVALEKLIAEVIGESGGSDLGRPAIQTVIAGEATVVGDRLQLSQLLHNLIDNAQRHGGEEGVITVSLLVSAGQARLSVSDKGPGIAAQHLPRLTERFYRVDSARSRQRGGTGLGLAIVKHIVERHRGRLDIASTPGMGTTVSITLPVVSGT